MTKEQLLALGLDEAAATKVAAASAEELKGYVPQSDHAKEVEAKKQLETDLKTRDKQLEELKKVDAAGLQQKIEELQTANKTTKTEYEAKIRQMQIDSAVTAALTGAKAKNLKAVRALLDLEKAELDGETVKGLADQVKKLQEAEDTKFLFETPGQAKMKGVKPAEGGDKNYPADKKPSEMTYTELCAYLEANPGAEI
ncbi:MAG TPA: phage scaffolding protein [Selenomonadales bacterium]|nr:phage scaffolding protein [Selenomonadales bacterium]